jgi:hypothetical protein
MRIGLNSNTHISATRYCLGQAKLGAIRFYLPAAATVYAIPYVLKQTAQPYLWALCAGVAGLLVLTMTQTLCVATNGIRRLGVYIRDVIEPRTNGGLRWENAVNHFDRHRLFSLGQSLSTSLSAIVANVVAATGAAFVFLPRGPQQLWPILASVVTALPALPGLWQILRPTAQREKLAERIATLAGTPPNQAHHSSQRPIDKAQAAFPSQRQSGALAAATNARRERVDSRRDAAPLPLARPANGPIVALIDELGRHSATPREYEQEIRGCDFAVALRCSWRRLRPIANRTRPYGWERT